MKRNKTNELIVLLIVCSFLFLAKSSFSENINQKQQMTLFSNDKYGLKFSYPKEWELQSHPAPSYTECELEISLRPPSWLSELEAAEYRRYYDYPLQILICRKDFESFIRSQGYYREGKEWFNRSHGLNMEATEIKGRGWYGIIGEVSFKSVTKAGAQGPELFLWQAIVGLGKNRSALIIMENTGSPWDIWDIDDLLKSLVVKSKKIKDGLTIKSRRR